MFSQPILSVVSKGIKVGTNVQRTKSVVTTDLSVKSTDKSVLKPNLAFVVRANVFRENVFRANVFQANVFRANVFRANIFFKLLEIFQLQLSSLCSAKIMAN
jgi:hypothetical protein